MYTFLRGGSSFFLAGLFMNNPFLPTLLLSSLTPRCMCFHGRRHVHITYTYNTPSIWNPLPTLIPSHTICMYWFSFGEHVSGFLYPLIQNELRKAQSRYGV